MQKSAVITFLRKFIEEKERTQENNKVDKAQFNFISVLKNIREEDISFGKAPSYFFAKIECNSTGVGVSSFEGTKSQRTVARDYITNEELFIDGHVGAGAKGLSLFYLKPNHTIHYHSKSDITKVAKRFGFQLHQEYFHDLNFRMEDHRLNRYKVHITQGPFTYPIYPIYAKIPKLDNLLTLGYAYEKDGRDYFIIEPEEKMLKQNNSVWWWILGLLFPPIGLALLFYYFIKDKLHDMIG